RERRGRVASSAGMLPLRLLLNRSSDSRNDKSPISGGSSPLRLKPGRLMAVTRSEALHFIPYHKHTSQVSSQF
ncbi:MAG: hypothetical protein KDC53_24705, partial [Saprospiraceae bacterium]|nr:hypothetical protein [Saprospiraceae bacterium]